MSLAELLPAIRALPKAEQVELLHLLVDGIAEGPPEGGAKAATDDLPERFRAMFPSGAALDVWTPDVFTTDAAGAAALAAALAELKKAGG